MRDIASARREKRIVKKLVVMVKQAKDLPKSRESQKNERMGDASTPVDGSHTMVMNLNKLLIAIPYASTPVRFVTMIMMTGPNVRKIFKHDLGLGQGDNNISNQLDQCG